MGKATGAGIVEGKGRQLITWAKSEQDAMGGKKAAFTQAAKLQLARKIPPSCFKTHVSPGAGVAAEVGGSQQVRSSVAAASFLLQSSNGCKCVPAVGIPLGPDISLWQTGWRSESDGTKPCGRRGAQHHARLLTQEFTGTSPALACHTRAVSAFVHTGIHVFSSCSTPLHQGSATAQVLKDLAVVGAKPFLSQGVDLFAFSPA